MTDDKKQEEPKARKPKRPKLPRTPMPEQDAHERAKNFDSVTLGYTVDAEACTATPPAGRRALFLGDLFQVDRLTFVGSSGVFCDYEQSRRFRKRYRQVSSQSAGKEV